MATAAAARRPISPRAARVKNPGSARRMLDKIKSSRRAAPRCTLTWDSTWVDGAALWKPVYVRCEEEQEGSDSPEEDLTWTAQDPFNPTLAKADSGDEEVCSPQAAAPAVSAQSSLTDEEFRQLVLTYQRQALAAEEGAETKAGRVSAELASLLYGSSSDSSNGSRSSRASSMGVGSGRAAAGADCTELGTGGVVEMDSCCEEAEELLVDHLLPNSPAAYCYGGDEYGNGLSWERSGSPASSLSSVGFGGYDVGRPKPVFYEHSRQFDMLEAQAFEVHQKYLLTEQVQCAAEVPAVEDFTEMNNQLFKPRRSDWVTELPLYGMSSVLDSPGGTAQAPFYLPVEAVYSPTVAAAPTAAEAPAAAAEDDKAATSSSDLDAAAAALQAAAALSAANPLPSNRPFLRRPDSADLRVDSPLPSNSSSSSSSSRNASSELAGGFFSGCSSTSSEYGSMTSAASSPRSNGNRVTSPKAVSSSNSSASKELPNEAPGDPTAAAATKHSRSSSSSRTRGSSQGSDRFGFGALFSAVLVGWLLGSMLQSAPAAGSLSAAASSTTGFISAVGFFSANSTATVMAADPWYPHTLLAAQQPMPGGTSSANSSALYQPSCDWGPPRQLASAIMLSCSHDSSAVFALMLQQLAAVVPTAAQVSCWHDSNTDFALMLRQLAAVVPTAAEVTCPHDHTAGFALMLRQLAAAVPTQAEVTCFVHPTTALSHMLRGVAAAEEAAGPTCRHDGSVAFESMLRQVAKAEASALERPKAAGRSIKGRLSAALASFKASQVYQVMTSTPGMFVMYYSALALQGVVSPGEPELWLMN